jgi:hypothetical protein
LITSDSVDPAQLADDLVIRTSAQEITRRHAEPVGQQLGHAKYDDDAARESGANGSGHRGERRDGTIDRAVDEVSDVAVIGATG